MPDNCSTQRPLCAGCSKQCQLTVDNGRGTLGWGRRRSRRRWIAGVWVGEPCGCCSTTAAPPPPPPPPPAPPAADVTGLLLPAGAELLRPTTPADPAPPATHQRHRPSPFYLWTTIDCQLMWSVETLQLGMDSSWLDPDLCVIVDCNLTTMSNNCVNACRLGTLWVRFWRR